jgi:hypothetical protein
LKTKVCSRANFWGSVFQGTTYVPTNVDKNLVWASFWAIFSQTNLVTLARARLPFADASADRSVETFRTFAIRLDSISPDSSSLTWGQSYDRELQRQLCKNNYFHPRRRSLVVMSPSAADEFGLMGREIESRQDTRR